MEPELLIHSSDGQTKRVPLAGDKLDLGRSHASDLCFPVDSGLSRRHLAFERDTEGWYVRDLGSKNGTLLNNVPLKARTRLEPGDRIAAGHLVIVYGPDEAGEPRNTVVFDNSAAGAPGLATVVTSLEGALSGDSLPAADAAGAARVRALVRAGRELTGLRPLPELFRLILDLSIEAVEAERGVLMCLEDDRLVVKAHQGENFRISAAVRDRVLKEKTSILVRDARQDADFRYRDSIVEQRVHTLMAAPLETQDRIIGLIYVDSPLWVRAFTKDDLSLLTVMANIAAVKIEQARQNEVEQAEQMLRRELEQAAEIQLQILPGEPPERAGLDVAGHNAPCHTVGGDYYDFIDYPDGRLGMALGDVSGKGMPASLMMMGLQARLQVLAQEPAGLAAMMNRLNQATAAHCPSNRFITFFFCVLDPATGDLRYSNAGHNAPLLVQRDGSIERLSSGDPVLGVVRHYDYSEYRTRMAAGDLLVIYSDGVSEALNPQGEEYGEERLAELLRQNRELRAAAVVKTVAEAVAAWSAGAPAADDLTLVVARRV